MNPTPGENFQDETYLKNHLFTPHKDLKPTNLEAIEIESLSELAINHLLVIGNSEDEFRGSEDSEDYYQWHALKSGIDALDFFQEKILGYEGSVKFAS